MSMNGNMCIKTNRIPSFNLEKMAMSRKRRGSKTVNNWIIGRPLYSSEYSTVEGETCSSDTAFLIR